jgi:hypothetical protein
VVEPMPKTAAGRASVGNLLKRAAVLYDDPACGLRRAALAAARRGFTSGAEWMRLALTILRGEAFAARPATLNFQALGFLKYGLAGSAALGCACAATVLGTPLLGLVTPLAFYLVEVQMVFLFPVALDGSRQPFREARRWTRCAGGTFAALKVVLPVAFTMVLGGLTGRGFIRSWCLGCLAICIWYVALHEAELRRKEA